MTAGCMARPTDHIALLPHAMPSVTFLLVPSSLFVFVESNLNLEEGTHGGSMYTDVLKLYRDASWVCLRVLR